MNCDPTQDNGQLANPLSGRLVVLGAAFASLVGSGVQLGLMPLAGLSAARDFLGEGFERGVDGDWFARYTAAMMLGGALGGIFLGSLGDRIGRTRAMAACVFVYSLFGALSGYATTNETLLGLRFLAGLGVGGAWPNAVALVSECWARASKPVVAGVCGTGINVGILVVSRLGDWRAVTVESWRWLPMLTGWTAVVGVISLFFVPESRRWLATRSSSSATPPDHGELYRPPLLSRTIMGVIVGAIPLIGAWGASKWMIPWADAVGRETDPGLKAATQGWWAFGAILGSFLGAQVSSLLGRRGAYFLISLGATTTTCGVFLFCHPLSTTFLPIVFVQGLISTMFFGWLPLHLPELFPTRVRAAGAGVSFNTGRFASAAGALAGGLLMAWSGGSYPLVGAVTGLVYALGMIAIWFLPEPAE